MPTRKPTVPAEKQASGPVIKITITEAQKAAFAAAAARIGVPLAIYVRMAAIEKTEREASKQT